MTTPDGPCPPTVVLASVASGVGALPLLFVTAVAWALAGSGDLPPWLGPVLLVLVVAQLAGAARLVRRRGRALLLGSSISIVLAVPLAVVATSPGQPGPLAETVAGLAVLVAGPALAGVLGSSPRARTWVDASQPPPR